MVKPLATETVEMVAPLKNTKEEMEVLISVSEGKIFPFSLLIFHREKCLVISLAIFISVNILFIVLNYSKYTQKPLVSSFFVSLLVFNIFFCNVRKENFALREDCINYF